MQVNARQTKEIQVDLDDLTIREIVLKKFRGIFDLPTNSYIEDGELKQSIEQWGGSHSWYDEEIIRDATEEDIAAVQILNKLRKEL